MKLFNLTFLALVFIFNIESGHSQHLFNYTNKNGLPSNNVYAIKQDKRGFIWATTDKGVVRFDGRNFKLFTIDNGLASNDNFAMLIDSKDNVWLYSFKAITKIEPKGKCKIFGNTKSYFNSFEILNDEIYFYTKNESDILSKIQYFKIKDDTLIELLKEQFEPLEKLNHAKKNKHFLKDYKRPPTVLDIPGGYAYYLENNYLIVRDGVKDITNNYPNNLKKLLTSYNISYNGHGYIVFNNGIFTHNYENDDWIPFLKIPKNTSILIDKETNVWVSTMGDGLFKYSNLELVSGKPKILEISSEPIKKVTGHKNISIWIAKSNNFIYELKKSIKTYKPDLIDLRFLEIDEKGDLYYGGSNAVYKNEYLFSKYGFKAICLWKNSLSLCSTFGVNFLQKNKLNSLIGFSDGRQYLDVTGRMYAILLLEGKFYAGNQQGLFWGITGVNALNPICLDDDEESVSVNGIKKSKDGLIWVATEGNGVYLLKDDVVIRHFNSELLDANIHSMKIDEKDRVWLATRKGINMIQKVGLDFDVDKYTSFHGLSDDYINDIYCYDDLLYVATDEGLVQLNIEEISKTNFKIPPPVHINSFRILKSNWQTLGQDSIHIFEHDENTVNFEYSGISYKSNGKVRFEYRLLPTQSEWLQTNNDNITFNNLEPNNYTFEVRAIDAIGNVSKVPAKVEFVIKKHFTDQLWFFFLIWLLALFIVLFIVLRYLKFRRLQAEETSRIEKIISELRLKSLQAQLNPHFIFNSLNAIQQFINTENKKSANDYLSRFARLMRLYLSGSDTQFISLAQELEVLKLYCSLEHLRFADKFQYSIQIDEKLSLDEYKVPAMLLQPHVENAIRHGLIPSDKDNNLLSIVVKATDNGIVCIIQDNGIGRARSLELKKHRSSNHRSMGNKISKERLEMIRSLNLANISEDITDIINNKGEICGTNVEIKITKNS